MIQWTRSRTQGTLPIHPNGEIVHSLPSIQTFLDQHNLGWHDHGRHADCQFTSFIHDTKKTVPGLDDIMQVRRGCKNWLLNNSSPLVESHTDWRDRVMPFVFGNERRKQGDEHSLCGLTGVFATRINDIIVTTSWYLTEQYTPHIWNIPVITSPRQKRSWTLHLWFLLQ